MKRWISYPWTTAALIFMWLLLNQTVSPGHVLLGIGIAITATWFMSALQIEKPRIRVSSALVRLVTIVLHDIIRSNISVAFIIISRSSKPTSGFVQIPLTTSNRYSLAFLACIITATPGTLWVDHDIRRNVLLLHVLDLVDETHWIQLVKNRYEKLLMEIFL